MKPTFLLLSILFAAACIDGADPATDSSAAGGKADDFASTDLRPTLPVLGAPSIVFEPAPELAAVQPTASLHFTYASCAKRNFELKKDIVATLDGDRTLLQIEDHGADCFGPTIVRSYAIQVTSDAFAERNFVLLNPSALTFSN